MTATVHTATAAEMRAALKRHYVQPEAAVLFEVAQSTGHNAHRHLDAVAMELWPSRGLAFTGIEIKVSLSDWRREKANPEKAEQIARFCDYFFIAAPKGVVPIAELPSAWGLFELMPDGRLNQSKPASKTEAEPVNRAFVAALLRAASRPVDPETLDGLLSLRRKELEAEIEKRVKTEAERLTTVRSRGNEKWEQLCTLLGRDAGSYWPEDGLLPAIKAVHDAGVAASYSGLKSLIATVEETAARLRTAAGEMAIPIEENKSDKTRRHLRRHLKAGA